MGPRSGERGEARDCEDGDQVIPRASMGPRSGERGEITERATFSATVTLQWGRARVSAESLPHHLPMEVFFLLQWGRARVSAESGRRK